MPVTLSISFSSLNSAPSTETRRYLLVSPDTMMCVFSLEFSLLEISIAQASLFISLVELLFCVSPFSVSQKSSLSTIRCTSIFCCFVSLHLFLRSSRTVQYF